LNQRSVSESCGIDGIAGREGPFGAHCTVYANPVKLFRSRATLSACDLSGTKWTRAVVRPYADSNGEKSWRAGF
jgi:hypothetical protein